MASRRRPLLSRSLSIVFSVAAIAAACGSDDASEADTPSSTAASTTSEPTITDETTTGQTLDNQIAWVLEVLNGRPVSEAEVNERFTAEFLAQRSAAAVVTSIGQLRGVSESWTETTREGDDAGAEVRVATESEPWVILIAIANDGSIEFMNLQPDNLGEIEPPTNFEEIVEALAGAGRVSMLVADVSGETCEPIHAVDALSPQPIGSDFKLYVLGALIKAIEAGTLRWDDPLAIRDNLKSLPSGTFQDLAAGTELTVGEFAEAMIATSDNTATDHLMDLLGRERVEAAQATYGHADPELNEPFLTTREFFVLKLALSDDDRDAYIAAGSDERRTILDSDVAETDVFVDDAITWIAPRDINEIEYFASPIDLCRAMIALVAGETDPSRTVARDILGANPGVPVDDADWSYVGFKGGSEPGVLSLAWYLEGQSGTFAYVVNVTNTDTRLSETQLAGVAAVGFDLLAAS